MTRRRKIAPVRLVNSGWWKELTDALRMDSSELLVLSPYITVKGLDYILDPCPRKIRVITRFKLDDFAARVSDIPALRKLLDVGAQIGGIRDLHAKLYVFGNSRAIITSANLTKSALENNHELGIVTEDATVISGCQEYFDYLWKDARRDLTSGQLDSWEEEVTYDRATGGFHREPADRRDFGAKVDFATPSPIHGTPAVVADVPQAIVKFTGEGHNRAPMDSEVIHEIRESGCHWAVAYPYNKRPRIVEDGAIIFVSFLTRDWDGNGDTRILGRAVGMAYEEGRDDATPADIEYRSWKEQWPHYIRVHHAEFIAGTLANGVSLYELMAELGSDSFETTQHNAKLGEGNTEPRLAIRNQAAVRLSDKGFRWLSERLEMAFDVHGKVPRDTLRQLDRPTIPQLTREDAD